MTVAEVRKRYLEFFARAPRNHAVIPSASLIPENDPTTLFTGSGMQPMLPYLLGEKHPAGKRIVDSQKCFRTQDIEEVGDNRHTTFFEMLGNWSFGDYWKEEQLSWLFEFLTKEINIPKEKLWVSCFEGNEALGLSKDTESVEIWEKLGMPKDHIRFYGVEKNWWSRSGIPEKMPVGEPGGPDSEIFYEFAQVEHDIKFGAECHPNCDCGRFMEIGNSVFMEYRKTTNGFEKLVQRNVDFGGGLERITAAANNEPDIFEIDIFRKIFEEMVRYGNDWIYSDATEEKKKDMKIIADHLRASVFLIADGVLPSNKDRGSFVRRLLRVAIYKAYKFARGFSNLYPISDSVMYAYGLKDTNIHNEIETEEGRFMNTLKEGEKVRKNMLVKGPLTQEEVFKLHTTFGLPLEFLKYEGSTLEINIGEAMELHKQISRAGAEKKFKGGLADTSEMSVRYHTATHLLHQALRDVLGKEVQQKGSNITPERLRFDFAFSRKMTDEEKKRVEEIVNEKIKADLPVHKITLAIAEAKQSGALHFFDEK